MLDRRHLMASGLAFGAAAAASPCGFAADAKVVSLRFALRGGEQPVTVMTIGKNGPYIVLLDTGDNFGPMLREDLAKQLNLRRLGEARIYGATGTDTGQGYAAQQVVFGGQFLAEDVNFMGTRPMGGLDGIVPIGLFTAHYTEMDFVAGEMHIYLSGAPDRAGFRPVRCERVRQDGHFIVEALVEGQKARLLVDTGAATTVSLNPLFVRRYGLWDAPRPHLDTVHGGITRALARTRLVKTPTLQVGAYRFQDAVIGLDDPSLTLAGDLDGLLGIDLLKRFTVGFDAAGSTVWLKPNPTLSDPFLYDHAGLRLKLDNGTALVEQVSPGGPAEQAGFKVGDRLREFDTPQKLGRLEGRLYNGPLDTPITLAVVRDGRNMPIQLTPKDWL